VTFDSYAEVIRRIFSDVTISSSKKVQFAEKINKWGDPRINAPGNDEYWVNVDLGVYQLKVAQHMVTMKEWKEFLSAGYSDDSNWCASGLKWRSQDRPTWEQLASSDDSKKYLFDNQPVVGVCWFEAQAYAKANNARLMSFSERLLISRGVEKRPYPWGEWIPGNANTQEEVLNKPCAVGLYNSDCTPEGIYDLAGNVAEWTEDEDETKRVIHPGSWNIGSLGAWCKASTLYSAAARTGYLGFRLVRDN
jgi:formylglycine-generating enzyme required for sulfatase activity